MNFSDVQLPSNRKFGLFLAVVLAFLSAFFFTRGSSVIGYCLSIFSTILLLLALFQADLLLSANKLWMRFGFLLGMIVSPIVLGAIFFGLFTPIGFLTKLFGRDELRLKLSSRTSYWKSRDTRHADDDAFNQQF